ncbi:DUF6241 domain-containing protein [Neobacillus ginsengisoli]|uniref:Uncharacterized protein n=1 Tax=Neobacillus ginsengisoli TaxID=904295 RepID=A0ABT9XU81_9BACI|nr:DUF6241 domain-containing protein [Neobacillus ginsengisoli]MDQ0199118.1 hypothetical protein [Neobacillus ginsengisoli]
MIATKENTDLEGVAGTEKSKKVSTLKKYRPALIGIVVILVSVIGLYFNMKHEEKVKVDTNVNSPVNIAANEDNKKRFEAATPKDKMPSYETMREEQLIQEVHNMTHQLVASERKWGASEIKKDKINKLYNVVRNKEFGNNEAKEMILTILTHWILGDFSHAVEDHNLIWSYQGGTVGKATRLLTPLEEQQYIKKNFR